MTKEEGKKQLIEWLDSVTFCRGKKMYEFFEDDEGLRVSLYTDNFCYSIGASFNSNDGYLGGLSHCRKKRAGEERIRGNDLPDGKFSYNTWRSILSGIVRNELVEIFETPQPIKDDG